VAAAQLTWWQAGVIYQIYPRSFKDTDADGVGNLNGITSEVDYLHWLGVDAIWLSPIFTSPMVDMGYDVADYTGVDPVFGTLMADSGFHTRVPYRNSVDRSV
jgi:alpha-glucosidase